MGAPSATAAPEKLLSTAQRLWDEGQEHKHLARFHRNQAAKKLEHFYRFKRKLEEEFGIQVIIEPPLTRRPPGIPPIHAPTPTRRASDGNRQQGIQGGF